VAACAYDLASDGLPDWPPEGGRCLEACRNHNRTLRRAHPHIRIRCMASAPICLQRPRVEAAGHAAHIPNAPIPCAAHHVDHSLLHLVAIIESSFQCLVESLDGGIRTIIEGWAALGSLDRGLVPGVSKVRICWPEHRQSPTCTLIIEFVKSRIELNPLPEAFENAGES